MALKEISFDLVCAGCKSFADLEDMAGKDLDEMVNEALYFITVLRLNTDGEAVNLVVAKNGEDLFPIDDTPSAGHQAVSRISFIAQTHEYADKAYRIGMDDIEAMLRNAFILYEKIAIARAHGYVPALHDEKEGNVYHEIACPDFDALRARQSWMPAPGLQ